MTATLQPEEAKTKSIETAVNNVLKHQKMVTPLKRGLSKFLILECKLNAMLRHTTTHNELFILATRVKFTLEEEEKICEEFEPYIKTGKSPSLSTCQKFKIKHQMIHKTKKDIQDKVRGLKKKY